MVVQEEVHQLLQLLSLNNFIKVQHMRQAKTSTFVHLFNLFQVNLLNVNVESLDEVKDWHMWLHSISLILDLSDDSHDSLEHSLESCIDLMVVKVKAFNWTCVGRLSFYSFVNLLLNMLGELINELFADHKLVKLEDVQIFYGDFVTDLLDIGNTSEVFVHNSIYTLRKAED